MNIIDTISHDLQKHACLLLDISPEALPRLDLTINTDASKQTFGDLSTNFALILAKQLGQNPRAIAQKIAETFKHEAIERIEIAGPGFINIFLTDATFTQIARELFNSGFAQATPDKQLTNYSIEFVSANPTGPLHLGHGRNAIIGDVLGNVLRFLGNPVTKEFYINDAGNQIQKLGESFKIRCMQALGRDAQIPEEGYHGEYLRELAVAAVQEFGADILHQKQEFFEQYAKERLLARLQDTLAEYGVHFDVWFSEKTLHESGAIEKALAILQEKGHLYEADGALWFRSTTFGDDKDRVVRKQTGELTYVAADIAYLINKIERGAQKLIMVLGQDHHSYVTRLKGIMQALGYNPDNLEIILYQLVTLKESGEYVRLSKRAGKIIALQDIIQTVGKDVARFFYLHRKVDAHLEFDIDLALKHSEENPVYYIQYAFVRTYSMLEKAATLREFEQITAQDIQHLGMAEKLLLKKIIELQSVLQTIERTYQTHVLAYYTLELAQAFHSFYAHNRVIDKEHIATSRARLALVHIIQKTFYLTFELLGISTPQRM